MGIKYLWLNANLTDASSVPVPLATYNRDTKQFEWVGGGPPYPPGTALGDVLAAVPPALAAGVSFNVPHSSIFEGQPFPERASMHHVTSGPDEPSTVDMPALLAWHSRHCGKCGHPLDQSSIDSGRCLQQKCLTMLVGVTQENVLRLHAESLAALGSAYLSDPLLSPTTAYPGLVWKPSGLSRLSYVLSDLRVARRNSANSRPALERINDIEAELRQKLQYLSDYGGDSWRVEMLSAPTPLSFSLFWRRKVGDEWKLEFEGCLQCDAVAQPFGSVVLGEPSYWSIHT